MDAHTVDKRRRKKAIKRLMKKKAAGASGMVKFSYYGSKVFYALAFIVGAVSAYKTSLTDPYIFEYLLPLLYFGGVCAAGLLLSAIYKGALRQDYMVRWEETVSFDGSDFVYSYKDDIRGDSANVSRFRIRRKDIDRIEYDNETCELILYGEISEERCRGNMPILTNTWSKLSVIDTFNGVELHEALR